MRPRELWFWLAAACLTAGAVLVALAIAYYTKEPHYSLSTGPHMIGAYAAFTAAFACALAAIVGWRPWLRWQRFPNLEIRIDAQGITVAKRHIVGTTMPTTLLSFKLHVINKEPDRGASIRAIYLRARNKDRTHPLHFQVLTAPTDPVEYDNPVMPLDLPLTVGPQASDGGWLVIELPDYRREQVDWPDGAQLEMHDAVSGKAASCPASIGTFSRRQGLSPTTTAERVTGPPQPPVRTRGAPWERDGSPWMTDPTL